MESMLILDEEDFKNILNGMVDGVITINQQGLILAFNTTAENMFGYTHEEVIGKNVNILMPEPDSSAHNFYLYNHITTGVKNIIGIGRDVTALRKNGETFPMRLSVIECPAKIENDRWFIGSCKDITLQKQQEEQLKRSMKMEAIGKLTSGIAHDYNNMLGVIMGYSTLLADEAKDHPKMMKYLKQIAHATTRAANLTSKLLSITRKRTDNNAEVIDINDILESDYNLLAKSLTPQIKLTIQTEKDLWPVFIEIDCLNDALLNLSINAMHAMPEGGKLNIATSNVSVATIDAQVINIPMGDYVKISISDTGTGMTDDVASHIFEPFYSTKGEKGTGLGLSQVYNFVTQSKGSIRVYSEPGQGTCFTIYLPRHMDEHSRDEVVESATIDEDTLNGTETILVVDDELAIISMTVQMLSSHGYKMFSATSGKEALTILENEAIDLVLSDVIMPEMDGFELAHLLRYTHPNVKILLSSGLENIQGKSVTNEALSKNLLTKPYTAEQLLIKIKETLGN